MTIDSENAKSIRAPFEIHCGLSSRTNTDLTFSVSGDVAAVDSNVSESLDSPDWSMRNLTDLSGDGFPADGSCSLLDSADGSLDAGKIGVRSYTGGTVEIVVTAASSIEAVTIAITDGTTGGTVTANSVEYPARRITVVPVGGKTITLSFTAPDSTSRIEIASITPGVTLEFTNDSLISCEIDLKSDLSISDPTYGISSIEIRAYYPTDISSAIANMGDDVPIWYYAGYSGDFSETRYFYLLEAADQTENIITLKGEDMSGKLEDAENVPLQRFDTTADKGYQKIYLKMKEIITSAGVKLVNCESSPSASGTTKTGRSMVLTEQSPREYVQNFMNLCHYGTFFPVFVDAGIPSLRWSKPSAQWTIKEEDCGDVSRISERNIAAIVSDGDYGISTQAERSGSWTTIYSNLKVTKNKNVIKNFSDVYYWAYSVTGQKTRRIWSLLNSLCFRPSKTSTTKKNRVKIRAKKLTVTTSANKITASRPGITQAITPIALGRIYQGTTWIYPNYSRLFDRSTVSGSFTWKGDPRIQPRDVFNFVRLDGTNEVCTIESVTLTHESGGTKAVISYRKGIV